jgi:radical SAM protein with 4Fe4S-binding SPASM domain
MIDACITQSRPAISFLPVTAVLEMTYRCSHKCLFCSCPWENPGGKFPKAAELSTREWKEAIQKISGLGVDNICFTGGEALLRDDLWEIIEYTASLKDQKIIPKDGQLLLQPGPIKLYLISNGEAVNSKVLKLCQAHNVQLSMSLPGLSTFSELTGGGDPDRVLRAFTLAKSLKLFTVVNITATKKNLFEIYETVAAAFLAGADQLLLNIFLRGGRGLSYSEDLALSPEEIISALDQAEEVLQAAKRFGSVGTELPKCLLRGKRYEKLEVASRCSAATGFFVIGPSGFIRVCNHSQVELCHFRDIESLKQNAYWQKFTQKAYLPLQCLPCPESGQCDGGCREEAHIIGGDVASFNVYASPL